MKKLAILVGAIALTGSTFAQRPVDANPFSLEGGLSLTTGNTFAAPMLKLRYFAADNIAGRLGIQYNMSKDITNHYGLDATGMETADSLGTVETKSSVTWISIGGSYHFSQMDALSPYVALDIMFGMSSDSEVGTDDDGVSYQDGLSYDMSSKGSGFGVGIGLGMDWYFAENVFLGAEIGMTFASWKDKGGDWSVTSGGTTTSGSTLGAGSSSSFGNSATGALRLGWRF